MWAYATRPRSTRSRVALGSAPCPCLPERRDARGDEQHPQDVPDVDAVAAWEGHEDDVRSVRVEADRGVASGAPLPGPGRIQRSQSSALCVSTTPPSASADAAAEDTQTRGSSAGPPADIAATTTSAQTVTAATRSATTSGFCCHARRTVRVIGDPWCPARRAPKRERRGPKAAGRGRPRPGSLSDSRDDLVSRQVWFLWAGVRRVRAER
jgi:hypothetical protein